ncbi:MAG TPA: NAD(P)-binding domain-containing protein [Tepidisphaeraceae bacterium]|jgi:thioredoxin reductase (NADPH)|nr:NAD(P)-binding domain-containing protein [Tepidisphaeraceae bacterium]
MSESGMEAAIIGAGPIGLEVAVGLKRAGIDYVQFDARQIGYTISWFAPQTRFFSSAERIAIAGVPLQVPDQAKASREEYLAYLRGVVQQFDLKVNTYEPIVGIEGIRGGEDGFILTSRPDEGLGAERKYRVRKLILATGGTDRPRRVGVSGEDLPHVSHYFRDPHLYFRKKLLIVGGKNSAVEAALRCYNVGAELAFSYRRSQLDPQSIKYWLLPEINGHIASGKIAGHFCTTVRSIAPDHVVLGPSIFASAGGGAPAPEQKIPADFVLLLIGYEADLSLLRMAGVALRGDCDAPVFDPHTMRTNVPNLYVAGTATGGTQDKYHVFIENCHVHADRIVAAITGATEPPSPEAFARPES